MPAVNSSSITLLGSPNQSYATRGRTFQADANGVIATSNLTGLELNDLYASQVVPYGANPFANFRNLIDGGDFTVNPFQRNIAGLASGGVISSAISNTPTYFADRFFAVGGASSAILMALVSDTSVQGFSQSLKVSRQSGNTNNAPINFGQVIESADSIRLQGQQVTLSFWLKQGTNFSGSNLTAQIISGTGTNQSAANMAAGSWTGQNVVATAAQSLSTTMTRYSITGTVPAGATQAGVLFSYTPSGTAGADDSFTINGIQLELGGSASAFEHRDVQVELEICQRYAWVIPEPASNVIVGVGGAVSAANSQVFYMATPVQFVKAPTVSVSAGTFKVAAAAAAAAATGLAAGSTHTVNAISLTTSLTQTVGLSATLQGGGGSGYIIASADF